MGSFGRCFAGRTRDLRDALARTSTPGMVHLARALRGSVREGALRRAGRSAAACGVGHKSPSSRGAVKLPAMETYAHAFYTWALAKHGVKAGPAAGIAGVVGAAMPDVPAFAATAYYVGAEYLWEGWSSMDSQETLDAIYFTGLFGATGSALHSLVPVAALLVLYLLLGLRERDRRGILLWFLLGWAGHTVADFFTHIVEDARPLFWPISGWEWSSPVSYYNSLYYGQEFFIINHGLMVLIVVWLLVKRILGRKKRQ